MPVPGLDPGIVAGIHVSPSLPSPACGGRVGRGQQDVDGRDKPGHDSGEMDQHGNAL
jgi:hypothetical protein